MIDLMCYFYVVLFGIMDMIFVLMFLYGQEKGYIYFDFGMVLLVNVGELWYFFIEEWVVYFIYEYGIYFYGF